MSFVRTNIDYLLEIELFFLLGSYFWFMRKMNNTYM